MLFKRVFILCFVGSALGAIYERASDLPKGAQYDFIVIGGGTGGNAVANRLSENPNYKVLVLEAGGTDQVLNSQVPFYATRLAPSTPYDWNLTTSAQPGLAGRTLHYNQGHILGGSSSINILGYTRGSSDDFDRYAALTGDRGWSWNAILPYFKKNERWTQPADKHNTSGEFDPAVHGFDGITSVSLPGFSQGIDHLVIQTTAELPAEFPFNQDMNSGHHIGIGWCPSTIGGGQRSSSASSYLGSKFITRKNLHVLLHARVTRILQTGTQRAQPVFQNVEFVDGDSGATTQLSAKKELILSAGAVHTPSILLHSGIGSSADLTKVGIKTLVNLPSVGQNLSDHPVISNVWFVNSTNTFETAARNATLAADELQQWNTTKTGPLVDSFFNHLGWLRAPANSSIFNGVADPAAGPDTAHYEFVITNGLFRPTPPSSGNFINVATGVVTPTSRGSVTINSTNPLDAPILNPNLLGSDFDLGLMREAIRSSTRFLEAPAWNGYVLSPADNSTSSGATDDQLNQYIQSGSGSLFHPVGTAAMSPKGAKYGVVDPDLRVKGVVGLRVVDASVLPIVPAAHTQAAVYAVAERAADLIKASW